MIIGDRSLMIPDNTPDLQSSLGSQTIFLSLIGLWSASQLMSVLGFLPEPLLSILHYSKNILGVITVIWALFVILLYILQQKVLVFDKQLYVLALLFPFYITLINIVRYEISWKEVILYWFWVTGVYLAFPVMLQSEQLRRKAIKVLFWTDLLVLFSGIFLGVIKGRYYTIGHGERMVFSFVHPNYYANSWQIVFAMAFYFVLTVKQNLYKIPAIFLMLVSIVLMLLAGSRNTLVASILMLLCYAILNKKWTLLSQFPSIFILVATIMLAFLFINPSADKIDQMTTRRLSIWRMTLEANLAKASASDYLLGFGNYKINYGRSGPGGSEIMDIDQERLARNHVDNAYLDIFLQNGLIGFFLFFLPLVIIMRRTRANAVSAAKGQFSRQARLALGCWVGILAQMTTASVIPSFGNVINIFILVFMTPMALKIKDGLPVSGEEGTSGLPPLRSIET
jgi:O-antigen ligase